MGSMADTSWGIFDPADTGPPPALTTWPAYRDEAHRRQMPSLVLRAIYALSRARISPFAAIGASDDVLLGIRNVGPLTLPVIRLMLAGRWYAIPAAIDVAARTCPGSHRDDPVHYQGRYGSIHTRCPVCQRPIFILRSGLVSKHQRLL